MVTTCLCLVITVLLTRTSYLKGELHFARTELTDLRRYGRTDPIPVHRDWDSGFQRELDRHFPEL